MGIDYTKSSSLATTEPPQGKVTLTKNAPTVSLTKKAASTGLLRVNLNWNSAPAEHGRGSIFKRRSAAEGIDLDLGCLYEFTDGSKGVVQALGSSFEARPREGRERVIWLDGDDRTGTNSAGENLFVDLAQTAVIRRILVFAFIYEGAPNWAAANGVVTMFPVSGPQVEVRLDEPRNGARICGIAMLDAHEGQLSVHREVRYVDGAQEHLDAAYGWGMRWSVGRK